MHGRSRDSLVEDRDCRQGVRPGQMIFFHSRVDGVCKASDDGDGPCRSGQMLLLHTVRDLLQSQQCYYAEQHGRQSVHLQPVAHDGVPRGIARHIAASELVERGRQRGQKTALALGPHAGHDSFDPNELVVASRQDGSDGMEAIKKRMWCS